MNTAIGEHRQSKCNTFSDSQPVETVQQRSDVVIVTMTGSKNQSCRGILKPVDQLLWQSQQHRMICRVGCVTCVAQW